MPISFRIACKSRGDQRWWQRPPAMAAGLAAHGWSLEEWLTLQAVQRSWRCSIEVLFRASKQVLDIEASQQWSQQSVTFSVYLSCRGTNLASTGKEDRGNSPFHALI